MPNLPSSRFSISNILWYIIAPNFLKLIADFQEISATTMRIQQSLSEYQNLCKIGLSISSRGGMPSKRLHLQEGSFWECARSHPSRRNRGFRLEYYRKLWKSHSNFDYFIVFDWSWSRLILLRWKGAGRRWVLISSRQGWWTHPLPYGLRRVSLGHK